MGSSTGSRASVRYKCSVMGVGSLVLLLQGGSGSDVRVRARLSDKSTVSFG